jgi:hypothetical protein
MARRAPMRFRRLGAIGELILGLPAGIGPPVFVQKLEMRNTAIIARKPQLLELRHCDPESDCDSSHPRFVHTSVHALGSCQLLQKITTVRVS